MEGFYNEWGFCASARVLGYRRMARSWPSNKKGDLSRLFLYY